MSALTRAGASPARTLYDAPPWSRLRRATGCEGDFDWVGDVGLVDAAMDERALALDIFQVFVHVAIENFLDLVVVEGGVQATGETLGTARVARAGSFRDGLERGLHHGA